MTVSRPHKQFCIRLDIPLYEALKDDAAAHGRTVAQSMRLLLRAALQAERIRRHRAGVW